MTIVNRYFLSFGLLLSVVLLSSCVSSPPRHIDNLCHIFDEKASWYKKAKKSEKRWGSPIPVMMAIMRQDPVSARKPNRRGEKSSGSSPALGSAAPMAIPKLKMKPGDGIKNPVAIALPIEMSLKMPLILSVGTTIKPIGVVLNQVGETTEAT